MEIVNKENENIFKVEDTGVVTCKTIKSSKAEHEEVSCVNMEADKGNFNTVTTDVLETESLQTEYINANVTHTTKVIGDIVEVNDVNCNTLKVKNIITEINDNSFWVAHSKNTWRTLTLDEVAYLLEGREEASLLWGYAAINNIIGLIILNDFYYLEPSILFSQDHNSPTELPTEDWENIFKYNSVFLPIVGYKEDVNSARTSDSFYHIKYSTDISDSELLLKIQDVPGIQPNEFGDILYSVRLVKDDIKGLFSVAPDKKVSFSTGNLQYNSMHKIYRFAKNSYEFLEDSVWSDVFAVPHFENSTDYIDYGENTIFELIKPNVVEVLEM